MNFVKQFKLISIIRKLFVYDFQLVVQLIEILARVSISNDSNDEKIDIVGVSYKAICGFSTVNLNFHGHSLQVAGEVMQK